MISEQLHKDAIRFKEWHEGRTATALEKLAELDKAGKLAGVIAALKG